MNAPSPLIGGSWPGSPSTRIGLPKLMRSRAMSSPTIETSSSTISRACAASLCGLSAKRGFFICDIAWHMASIAASAAVRSKPASLRRFGSRLLDLFARGLDLLVGRDDDAVDQAVDGARWRSLAAQHQSSLAGEGGGDDAGDAVATIPAALVWIEPQFGERKFQDGGLARPRIAEQPKNLLLLGPVVEPVLDGGDRARLGVRGRDVGHDNALQQRSCQAQAPCQSPPVLPPRQSAELLSDGCPRKQLLHFARAYDQRGAVAGTLRKGRIEGDQFAMQLERVAVERREQCRIGQVEIGLIERDLRRVDRSRDARRPS